MPVVSAVPPLLSIYTATDLHCNLVKCIRAMMKGGEMRGKKALLPALTSQMALNFCINLWCNPNPDAGCLLNRQYKLSNLLRGFFQPFRIFFGGWLACSGFIVLSFLSAFTAWQRVKRPFRSFLDATPCLTRKLPAQ